MEEFLEYEGGAEMVGLPLNQSAFTRYRGNGSGSGRNHPNMNKRVIDFLRRSYSPMLRTTEAERGRAHRHMMNERRRREKQNQSFLALHSALSPGAKADKQTIIQTAAKEVEELQRYKEELRRQNNELEAILGKRENEGVVGDNKIRIELVNPSSSGIDCMVEVLKCLKSKGAKIRAIQSKFSSGQFSAVLEVESQNGDGEVEKAVYRTVDAVERDSNAGFHFPEY